MNVNPINLPLSIAPDDTFPVHADLIIPQFLAKQWHLVLQAPFTLSHGSAVTQARLLYSRQANKKSTVRIRKSTAQALRLTHGGRLHLRYLPQYRRLQFGPLLGILTNGIHKQAMNDQRFGDMTRFYTECHLAAESQGVRMFIFAPGDLLLQAKEVNGWMNVNGHWKRTVCPLPDVIYNRITSRRIETQESLQQSLRQLKKRQHVKMFNEQFLDKWQVHRALSRDAGVRFILPETKTYEKSTQLKEMLRCYPIVYIKPVNGSLGQGVIRLTLRGTRCHMQYTTLNGTMTKLNVSLQEISRQMVRRIRYNPYLIQQGLPLITSLGRNIDFRALVQKNGRGKWSVTSIVGRIAGDTNIVSNLARGGTVATVPHILKQVDPGQPKPTLKQLRQYALAVAHAFERQVKGHFAELGIDLAVDRQGKVWLLEINSKPSKTDDAVANPTLAIRPSVHKTMHYTRFITGYPPQARIKRR